MFQYILHNFLELSYNKYTGFPGGSVVKNLPANAGGIRNTGSTPGSGRSPGESNGNPLQYSYLENPHGERSLAEYGPWGYKESDTAELT